MQIKLPHVSKREKRAHNWHRTFVLFRIVTLEEDDRSGVLICSFPFTRWSCTAHQRLWTFKPSDFPRPGKRK